MKIIISAIFAIILATNPAYAEKGGNGHGKNKDKVTHDKGHKNDDNEHGTVIIHNSDRQILRDYVYNSYTRNCHPGLAKKHNGCLPPGQAKKHYQIGKPLEASWEYLPRDILVRLDPPPHGYQYVKVDQDVLLIAEASKKVIDAVTLLSAVRK